MMFNLRPVLIDKISRPRSLHYFVTVNISSIVDIEIQLDFLRSLAVSGNNDILTRRYALVCFWRLLQ